MLVLEVVKQAQDKVKENDIQHILGLWDGSKSRPSKDGIKLTAVEASRFKYFQN